MARRAYKKTTKKASKPKRGLKAMTKKQKATFIALIRGETLDESE